MNIVELLFTLLQDFSPIDSTKAANLKVKALDWYGLACRPVDENGQPIPNQNAVAKFFGAYGEQWYTQIGLAFAYIPLKIWLHGMMHPEMGTGETKI